VGDDCGEQKKRIDEEAKPVPFEALENHNVEANKHAAFVYKAGKEEQRKESRAAAQNKSKIKSLIQYPRVVSERACNVSTVAITINALQHVHKKINEVRTVEKRVIKREKRVAEAHDVVLKKKGPAWHWCLLFDVKRTLVDIDKRLGCSNGRFVLYAGNRCVLE
jgi:hypothetical protein